MGVAKARLLTSLPSITMPVTKKALVIGGGVAGLVASLTLARHGFGVDLVERTDRLGGQALRLNRSWRGEAVAPFVERLVQQVGQQENLRVHFNAEVTEATGVMGNFNSRLNNGQDIKHGVVIMATGGLPYIPEGEYLYGQNSKVLLTLDLDREIREQSARVTTAGAAAFIQCVGSRIPERPYCSRVCCTHSVDNALKLKELNPDMEVYVLYRDMRTYGERERLYLEAREKGVVFIRFRLDDPPRVEDENGRLKITVMDPVLQRPLELGVDILTLATAIVPYDNRPVAEIYKTALNAEGFFSEAHAKIRPVDSAAEGIFLAGLCHNPKPIEDAIRLALATAARSATILSKETLMLDAIISHPVDENCDGCAYCVDTCPYHAITLVEYMKEGAVKKTVEVNEALCKGCGSCMATCPKSGIYVAGFSLEQLQAQVDAALGEI
jgi:heterodisulfide reductase subunit A